MQTTSPDAGESGGDFAPLDQGRCQELLGSHSIGRVAWQAADGPQVLPVTYGWFEDRIVFRTSPYGVLSELVRPTDVAMEIDELDQTRHTGWSVVVQGRAEAAAGPDQPGRLWESSGVVPWAAGTRNLWIQIVPRRISGRRVSARER